MFLFLYFTAQWRAGAVVHRMIYKKMKYELNSAARIDGNIFGIIIEWKLSGDYDI